MTKWNVNCIASNICSTIAYFDLLNTTVNNNQATDRFFTFCRSIFYIHFLSVAFRSVFQSWLLLSRGLEITLRHSKLGVILRTSDQTLRTTPDNIQHSEETDIHALGGISTPIPASKPTQIHALDSPATGIDFSVIYSLYVAIRSTK
jgi:hypothetical protein